MKTNWALQKFHGYTLDIIENMYPWERIVYMDIIAQKMKEEARESFEKSMQQRDNLKLINR